MGCLPVDVPYSIQQKCGAIFSKMDEVDRPDFLEVIGYFVNLVSDSPVVMKMDSPVSIKDESIVCWHSRVDYTEDILGYGIKMKINQFGYSLTTDAQYISKSAYDGGLRQYPNKDFFQFFLPAWINPLHSSESKEWFKALLSSINTIGKSLGSKSRSEADCVLAVFPEIINRMVVEMMLLTGDKRASECIFQCILNLWRTFYYVAKNKPGMMTTLIQKINGFVKDPKQRLKSVTPDIGQTLVIASLLKSDHLDWKEFMKVFDEESFLRRVRWWQKDRVPTNEKSTFLASLVSCKNILFQTTFKRMIISLNDIEGTVADIDATNCKLPDRLSALLEEWKLLSYSLDTATSWEPYVNAMFKNGVPEESKDRFLANPVLNIHEIIKKADKIDGYFFKSLEKGFQGGRGGKRSF